MTTNSADSMKSPQATGGLRGAGWVLALIPLILLGIILTLIVVTGGGLTELAGPPVEQVSVQRVTLPEPGIIRVELVNDGPQEVTIPQVLVDDAYFMFEAEPSTTIPRFGRATYTIYYPWVAEETHAIVFLTSLGATFEAKVPVAVETPQASFDLFLRFGLVGLYVGIVPVALGMLWYPFMRRLSAAAMRFILALTVGLLVYLALGTWLDANEFAAELPVFWQGVPMVVLIALVTLGVLLAVSSRRGSRETSPLGVAYRIALGIGLHNLGEGVGIAAPVVRENPGLRHFALLTLLASGPAILGTWLGGFAFDPVLATVFLAIGIGAILQVVWEVGRLAARDSARTGQPLVNWVNLSGVAVGLALMYFTAFLVKF